MAANESFSGRLKALRIQHGLSKSAVARAVGVSTTCVWNWEEGNTRPRPDALARTAVALSTTEAYLERGVGSESVHASTAPTSVADANVPESVSEVIRRAREQVARAAGLTFEQVRVVLEYGA